MAALCGMPTIQHSARRARLSVHKLFFLHLTRPSVTWLNSQWWLAACDWVMSALSALLSTRVGRRRKFVEVPCTEFTGQGMTELIPTVKKDTRNLVDGYFGSEFRPICNHCGFMAAWSYKTLNFLDFFAFFRKTTPYGKFFKMMFRNFLSRHQSTCCVQI